MTGDWIREDDKIYSQRGGIKSINVTFIYEFVSSTLWLAESSSELEQKEANDRDCRDSRILEAFFVFRDKVWRAPTHTSQSIMTAKESPIVYCRQELKLPIDSIDSID